MTNSGSLVVSPSEDLAVIDDFIAEDQEDSNNELEDEIGNEDENED